MPELPPMPPPAVIESVAVVIWLVPDELALFTEPVPAFSVTVLAPLRVSAVAPLPRLMLPLLLIVSE